MSYESDREWSDKFIPAIKRIVGPLMLEPSNFTQDATQATDLVMLCGRDLDIACRVRRQGYAERYPWQFTIRDERDSGASTEFEKIACGFADWFFYGHAADQEGNISRWFLVSLSSFRTHLILNRSKILMGRTPNGDGTWFRWFDVRSFPASPPLLVTCSEKNVPPLPSADAELDDILNP